MNKFSNFSNNNSNIPNVNSLNQAANNMNSAMNGMNTPSAENMANNMMPGMMMDESAYPEVYQKLAPIADQLIHDMEKQYGNIMLDSDLLKQMNEELLRRAGLPQNYGSNPGVTKDEAAVPTMYEFGGRHGHGGRPWHGGGGWYDGYGVGPLGDVASILLLNRIFGWRRPYWRWR